MRLHVVGTQAYRLPVAGDRPRELTNVFQSMAQVAMRFGQIGSLLDNQSEHLDGFVITAEIVEHAGQIDVDLAEPRFCAQGGFIMADSLGGPAQPLQRIAQVRQSFGKLGFEPHRLFVASQGFGPAAAKLPKAAPGVP